MTKKRRELLAGLPRKISDEGRVFDPDSGKHVDVAATYYREDVYYDLKRDLHAETERAIKLRAQMEYALDAPSLRIIRRRLREALEAKP